jgi:hypothetical protein
MAKFIKQNKRISFILDKIDKRIGLSLIIAQFTALFRNYCVRMLKSLHPYQLQYEWGVRF